LGGVGWLILGWVGCGVGVGVGWMILGMLLPRFYEVTVYKVVVYDVDSLYPK